MSERPTGYDIVSETFSQIYEAATWGKGSGPGSYPQFTVEYRAFLERFLRMNQIRSIVDVGCGDWQSTRLLDLDNIQYLGLDIVPSIIESNVTKFSSGMTHFAVMPRNLDELPQAELLIIKDVLQHLPNDEIKEYIRLVFPKFRLCLITNSFEKITTPQNVDIKHGEHRCLDLTAPPFDVKGFYVSEYWAQPWERIRTLLIAREGAPSDTALVTEAAKPLMNFSETKVARHRSDAPINASSSTDQRKYFATCFGTVLGLARSGKVVHRAPGSSYFLPLYVRGDDPHHLVAGSESEARYISINGEVLEEAPRQTAAAVELVRASATMTALRVNDKYLVAFPDGAVLVARDKADAWESFTELGHQDFRDLEFLLANRWVQRHGNEVSSPQAFHMLPDFKISLGDAIYLLSEIFPLRFAQRPPRLGSGQESAQLFSTYLYRDGWKIDRIHLYRPIVYFTAFGPDEIFEMVKLSIQSLIEFSEFDGDILVISDRTRDALITAVGIDIAQRVQVWQIRADDWIAYTSARYRFFDWWQSAAYQPILYSDADVLFDIDLTGLLSEIAAGSCLTAGLEPFSQLSSAPSVGQRLLSADAVVTGEAKGFNSGNMAVPNVIVGRRAYELILESLNRQIEAEDRRLVATWPDQAVANYVAFKVLEFDLMPLSLAVRYDLAWDRVTPEGRRGIVHFFHAGPAPSKIAWMTDYRDRLRALLATPA